MLWEPEDMVRVLAPSEQRFVRHGTYTGRSVTVRGELDAAAIGAAFAALQRAYPILVCRIEEDADGTGILVRPGAIQPVGALVGFGDPDEIRIPTESVDPAAQLAYLDVVLGEDDRARVTLFVHHAVADAGHCVELFARLWEYYTVCAGEGAVEATPHDYPRALEDYVTERGITAAAASGLEDAIVPFPPDSGVPRADPVEPAPPALARPDRLVLDPADTTALLAAARANGVTVNALITAVLLRAYAAATGRARVATVYPVDLRRRLGAPVPAAAGTNMAGLAAFAADIALDGSPYDLAARLGARLADDLADGVVAQSVLHFPDFYGPGRIHSLAGHVAITNTGAVPPFAAPAALSLDDYEIVYLSAHPRPSAGPSAAVTVLVYTYAGRLTLGVLGGGSHTQRLPAAMTAELDALTDRHAVAR
ncbi:phthiocerol/phthiodiolone dimycocerosyl transferase family protein [Nocardia thailandica]|uniref:phthiocerol/phthiodiolone dimycocerosyl transferase family protein n=1 Tax=Nocardia thailandica TaxID=257275 RepID=UPI001FDF986B|nr:acyltransferase [Nocardia thailandica]